MVFCKLFFKELGDANMCIVKWCQVSYRPRSCDCFLVPQYEIEVQAMGPGDFWQMWQAYTLIQDGCRQ